ncbi:hypothetical protein GALL_509250 [mine drainage metagenome]|uniref:Uncharacterized protein n=1 Tax=mine drainage metagenome TaxID=410659 RepID=A0A1J5P8B3_9ZZZZ
MTCALCARPALSRPVPLPAINSGAVPSNAAATVADVVVLPIPISPKMSRSGFCIDARATARCPQPRSKATSAASSAASLLKSRLPLRGLSVTTPGSGPSASVPASTTSSCELSSRAMTEIAAPPPAKFAIIAIVTSWG